MELVRCKSISISYSDKEAEALAAGANYVVLTITFKKIKDGWTDVDVIITMPAVWVEIRSISRILGPRIMPNPKQILHNYGCYKAVQEVKAGKIDLKLTKLVSYMQE
jgi:large subunit ribosomal protein L1